MQSYNIGEHTQTYKRKGEQSKYHNITQHAISTMGKTRREHHIR
jgi:hypothetical protein